MLWLAGALRAFPLPLHLHGENTGLPPVLLRPGLPTLLLLQGGRHPGQVDLQLPLLVQLQPPLQTGQETRLHSRVESRVEDRLHPTCSRRSLQQTAARRRWAAALNSRLPGPSLPRHSCRRVYSTVQGGAGYSTTVLCNNSYNNS